jgi:hypothetical protein
MLTQVNGFFEVVSLLSERRNAPPNPKAKRQGTVVDRNCKDLA